MCECRIAVIVFNTSFLWSFSLSGTRLFASEGQKQQVARSIRIYRDDEGEGEASKQISLCKNRMLMMTMSAMAIIAAFHPFHPLAASVALHAGWPPCSSVRFGPSDYFRAPPSSIRRLRLRRRHLLLSLLHLHRCSAVLGITNKTSLLPDPNRPISFVRSLHGTASSRSSRAN